MAKSSKLMAPEVVLPLIAKLGVALILYLVWSACCCVRIQSFNSVLAIAASNVARDMPASAAIFHISSVGLACRLNAQRSWLANSALTNGS